MRQSHPRENPPSPTTQRLLFSTSDNVNEWITFWYKALQLSLRLPYVQNRYLIRCCQCTRGSIYEGKGVWNAYARGWRFFWSVHWEDIVTPTRILRRFKAGLAHDDARFALDELFIATWLSTRKQRRFPSPKGRYERYHWEKPTLTLQGSIITLAVYFVKSD